MNSPSLQTVQGSDRKREAQLASQDHEVVCVCGGFGFPFGLGSSARIIMVGKALQMEGTGFRVLHCGPSPLALNTQSSGVFEGIPFEYTTMVRRPANVLARWLIYCWALLSLTVRLIRFRSSGRPIAVWLYIIDGPTNLYVGSLCRLLGLPFVQELCEWWPAHPACSRFTKWLYRSAHFWNSTGVLVISNLLELRAREAAAVANPRLRIHRLPAIVDAERFYTTLGRASQRAQTEPTFVWCGAQEWYSDVQFLIRAAAAVYREGYRLKLVIVGACSEARRAALSDYANQQGFPDGIHFTGYVEEQTLQTLLQSATALMLPMGDDDRSRTRMPNKLPEYLATGRPVITCDIGDLRDLLTDGVNAYMAKPGDEKTFVDQMLMVLRNPAAADRIGAAGRQVCTTQLDYRVHSSELAQFFKDCTHVHREYPVTNPSLRRI